MRKTPHEDLYVGSVPAKEACAQVGHDGYCWRAWHECRALIGQLRRMFGREPPGTRLYIRENPHDFGVYLSVNVSFPQDSKQGRAYAFRCEAGLPERWDDEARAELAAVDAPPPVKPNGKPRSKRQRKGVPHDAT